MNDIQPLPAEEQRPLLCEHCNQPVEEGIPCGCGDQEASVDAAQARSFDTPEGQRFFVDAMEHVGWPGDGTGEDDLADFNQNEADDYREG